MRNLLYQCLCRLIISTINSDLKHSVWGKAIGTIVQTYHGLKNTVYARALFVPVHKL